MIIITHRSTEVKVLIIEDDPGSIEIVALIFKVSRPDILLLSSKFGEEGLETVEKENPDVVILDLGLPDIDGFEVLRRLRLFSNVPVIVLTVREEERDVVKALELGANEYIAKPFRHLEFLARINNVMKKTNLYEQEYLIIGPYSFSLSKRQLLYEDKIIYLTNIESHILYLLIINKKNVVSYNTLYNNIWGDYYPGEENALRVHIQRIRKKLESEIGNKNLIITKSGIGYILNTND